MNGSATRRAGTPVIITLIAGPLLVTNIAPASPAHAGAVFVTRHGTAIDPAPTSFTLNGATCTVA
jgi:hypothetical protein